MEDGELEVGGGLSLGEKIAAARKRLERMGVRPLPTTISQRTVAACLL
jgi:hypothetical protein